MLLLQSMGLYCIQNKIISFIGCQLKSNHDFKCHHTFDLLFLTKKHSPTISKNHDTLPNTKAPKSSKNSPKKSAPQSPRITMCSSIEKLLNHHKTPLHCECKGEVVYMASRACISFLQSKALVIVFPQPMGLQVFFHLMHVLIGWYIKLTNYVCTPESHPLFMKLICNELVRVVSPSFFCVSVDFYAWWKGQQCTPMFQ